MIAGVVDYHMGNLLSVSKALQRAGAKAAVSSSPGELEDSDVVVVPGVGNFAAGMSNLRAAKLDVFLRTWAEENRPLLGICLGMQLFFSHSEEGDTEGLGVLDGGVVMLGRGEKVPHMGWNRVSSETPPFALADDRHFYFVHSYVCVPAPGLTAGVTDYGGEFACAVAKGKTLGVQFHPEKSGDDGIALLTAMLEHLA